MRHYLWSKDEPISDILLLTSLHGRPKVGRPPRTYIQQFCADTGCSLEEHQGAMDDRDGWRERGSGKSVLTSWWWCFVYLQKSIEFIFLCYSMFIIYISIFKQVPIIMCGFGYLGRIPTKVQMFVCCDKSVTGRHSLKRGPCLTIQNAINQLLIHEDVIYHRFSIICKSGSP